MGAVAPSPVEATVRTPPVGNVVPGGDMRPISRSATAARSSNCEKIIESEEIAMEGENRPVSFREARVTRPESQEVREC